MNIAASRPGRRLFYCLALLAVTAGLAPLVRADSPAKTLINDVIYRADGTPASGTLLVSWPAFTTQEGKAVAAGTRGVKIGPTGGVSIELVPNEGATPAGTYYKVTLKLDDGSSAMEYWTVPRLSPTTISAIRASLMPAGVALQAVSRTYVDSELAKTVHRSGDEVIDGAKQFTTSPLVPDPSAALEVANKQYVDAAAAGGGSGSVLALSRGGTGQNSWTASRCVRVASDGSKLESSAGDCGSTNADTVDGLHAVSFAPFVHTHTKSAITDWAHSHLKIDIPDFPSTWEWSAVANKPGTFPPESHSHTKSQISDWAHSHLKADITDFAHTHVKANITDFPTSWDWGAIANKPATFSPSPHGHAISDVTSLQTSLDGKAASVHTHLKANITDFPATWDWSALANVPSSFNPSAHAHLAADLPASTSYLGSSIQLGELDPTQCSDGQLIKKAAGAWSCETDQTGAGGGAPTDAQYVLSASNANLPNAVLASSLSLSKSQIADFAHNHLKAEITDFPTQWAWSAINGKPSTFPPPVPTRSAMGGVYMDAACGAGKHVGDIDQATGRLLCSDDSSLGGTDWSAITNKPATFPSDWSTTDNKPSSFTPSAHGHAISEVTNLQTSLDGKAASIHTQLKSSITDFPTTWDWTALNNVPSTFTPSAHTHTKSAITDWTHTHLKAEISDLVLAGSKPATGNQFLTSYDAVTGAFGQARPTWGDIDKTASDIANIATRPHTGLTGLDYASSGHTGFQAALGYSPLNPASNLSDVADAATARSNLGAAASAHSHSESDVTNLATDLGNKADRVSIAGATQTKITYNAQGIVTAGAQAASADLSDGSSLVKNNAGNTYSTGVQDYGSATALKVPTTAGAAPNAVGRVAYDSTANVYKGYNGSATKTFAYTDSNITGTAAGLSANIAEAQVTNLTADLAAREATANKNQANGYAGLNASSKLAASQLPASTRSALGGTFIAAACSAGYHVSDINQATGELACSADAAGTGASTNTPNTFSKPQTLAPDSDTAGIIVKAGSATPANDVAVLAAKSDATKQVWVDKDFVLHAQKLQIEGTGPSIWTLLPGTNSSPAAGDFWNDTNTLKFYTSGGATKNLAFTDSDITGNAAGITSKTLSGNGSQLATISGTKTVNKQLAFDASGNVVASSYDVGASGGESTPALTEDGTSVTSTKKVVAPAVESTSAGAGVLYGAEGASPSPQAAGKFNVYVNSTTHKLACELGASKTDCMPSGGSPAWGSISGTLSSQTDLQAALNAKVDEGTAVWPSSGTVATTTSNVSTATALAADPANCPAGQAAAGITANGTAEGCFTPSGSGNVTAGTLNNNKVPKATGATAIADSLISDDGTTASYSGSGGIKATAGPVESSGSGGGVFYGPTAASAPANPTAGNFKLWVDAAGTLNCKRDATGTSCNPAGGASLVTSGPSAGVAAYNAGQAATAARSDHTHRQPYALSWHFPGIPATGVQNLILTTPEGITNAIITDVRVTVNTGSASGGTFNVQRCTGSCGGSGATWGNIYATGLVLPAVSSTAGRSASCTGLGTCGALTSTMGAGDQFKANLAAIGSGMADVTITLTYKAESTN